MAAESGPGRAVQDHTICTQAAPHTHLLHSHVAPLPLPSPLCTASHLLPKHPHQIPLVTFTCPTTPALPSGCRRHWDAGMRDAGMIDCLVLRRAVQYPGGKKEGGVNPGEKYDSGEVML